MAQYDVFANPDSGGDLLDVQSDLLDDMNVRAVIPLLPQESAPLAANRLNPVFEIAGAAHVMMTQYIAAVPAGLLREPAGDLSSHFDVISSALDMLFHGF